VIEGQTYTFDVFGLQQGVLVMIDRETGSVWSHLDGEAIDGPLTGAEMEFIPILLNTWEDWRDLYPGTVVLSDDTPFRSRYRDVEVGMPNPRGGEDLLYGDDRLKAEELVLGVMTEESYAAYPLFELSETDGVVNDTIDQLPIVVFYDAESNSATAFSRMIDGREAEFELVGSDPFLARDSLTNTTWSITGVGVSGAAEGDALDFVVSYVNEWYGWSAYHPDTTLFASPE
jgi:hypothetical protein